MTSIRLPEVQHVRVFLAVARRGSFTAAAEDVHLSQPAVSQAIGVLEREVLHAPLFLREGRRVSLTPAGRRLLEAATRAYAEWEALASSAAERPGSLRGEVRMGVDDAVARDLLPEPLGAFARSFPEVSLSVTSLPLAETARRLASGELDLGLHEVSLRPPGLRVRTLQRSERLLLARAGTPFADARRLTPDDLARHPLVLPGPASAERRLVERLLSRNGLTARVAVESGDAQTVKRLVAAGAGVGIVPATSVSPAERRTLQALALGHLLPPVTVGLVTREGAVLGAAARELVRALREAPPSGL